MSYIIPLEQQQVIHGGDDDDDDDDHDNLSSESDIDDYEKEKEEEETISSPLNNMSTLLRQLPVKRGLSKHYDGKSQSFTSLSNVKCLEDLPKVENSYNNKKKLKSCPSYGGLLFYSDQNQPAAAAASTISRASCSGQGYNIGNSNSTRPPIARSRTSSSIYITGALLFA